MAKNMVDCWKRHDDYYHQDQEVAPHIIPPWNHLIPATPTERQEHYQRADDNTDGLVQEDRHHHHHHHHVDHDQEDQDETTTLSQSLHDEWVGIVQEICRLYPITIVCDQDHHNHHSCHRFRLVDDEEHGSFTTAESKSHNNNMARILLPLHDVQDDHDNNSESHSRRSLVVAFALFQPNTPKDDDDTKRTHLATLLTNFAKESSSISSSPPILLLAAGSVEDLSSSSEWHEDETSLTRFCILPIALPTTSDGNGDATTRTNTTTDASSDAVTIALYALYEPNDEEENGADEIIQDEIANVASMAGNSSKTNAGRLYATFMTIPRSWQKTKL
jgi:hypothetical protein